MKKLLSAALALVMGVTAVSTFAACGKKGNKDAEIAEKVVSGVRAMYVDKYTDAETPSDYDVVGQFPYEGVYYSLNWSVNVESGVTVSEMNATTKKVTIDVNEKTPTEIKYELTAAVTVGETTDSVTFKGLKVPAYKVTSNAEYWAAKDGDSLVCTGTVTAFAKKDDGASGNHIYFEDADGGYYAYNLSALPEGLAIGDEIQVTGIAKMYYGLMEITDCTVQITGKGTAVTPKDITSVVAAAKDNKDATLTAYQCQLVTIKGALLHNNVSNNTYYGFKLGNVDSYLRISGSDCPTGAANQTKIKADHAANIGKTATITGVVAQYSGAFYIVPVSGDAFKEFAENNLTDAEKVAEAKKAVVAGLIETRYAEVKNDIPLPAESWGATLTWSVKGTTDLVSITSGKLNVLKLPNADTNVTLTVAISCGEANDSAEVEITVAAPFVLEHAGTEADPFSVTDVKHIFSTLVESGDAYTDDEGKDKAVYIKGFVTNGGKVGSYRLDNVYLADDVVATQADSILVYTLDWNDKLATNTTLGFGESVVVVGYLKNFSGTKEVAQTGSYPNAIYPTVVERTAANLTNAQKVAIVKNNINLKASTKVDLDFPVSVIDGVTLSFASNKTAITVDNDNKKLVVNRGAEDETVTITVTISIGDGADAASTTAEFTVVVEALSATNEFEFTGESLNVEVGGYRSSGSANVNGIDFAWIGLGNYTSDGLRFRKNTGTGNSEIKNTTAFATDITKIVFNWCANSDLTTTRANAVKIEFANSADFSDVSSDSTKLVTFEANNEDSSKKVVELNVTGSYKYVRLTCNVNNTLYFDSIWIYCAVA